MMFNHMFYGGRMWLGAGNFWGGLIMLGLFLVVLAIVLWAIKNSNNNDNSDNLISDRLKMKLADGEISEDEYLRKMEILKRK